MTLTTFEMKKEAARNEAALQQKAPVWIVDDDRAIRWVLSKALSKASISSRSFERAQDVLDALMSASVSGNATDLPLVLVSDIRMPGMTGVELLERVKALAPALPVIIMTAFTDLESAVSSFQGGAFEYLTKPFDVTKAVELIRRAMDESAMRRDAAKTEALETLPLESPQGDLTLIGHAPAMQDVFRAIGRLSQSSVTVLLTGESGVGKEVVARAIWKHSTRSHAPFIAINMAAIPRELLESELFGHEKGAFTGATATRLGRFEQAKGGTLFLDEIGDMPMALQTSLLRVLSSGWFYRVGGHEPIKADVRVIAATNQDLEARVKSGEFREDLFHRLNVIRLRLPPLRDRKEDIEPLAKHFLAQGAKELGLEPKVLTAEALHVIQAHAFPGNVRELENLCRWLLVMAPAHEVRPEDLPADLRKKETAASIAPVPHSATIIRGVDASTMESKANGDWRALMASEVTRRLEDKEPALWEAVMTDVERILIQTALTASRGRRIEGAERLGIGRNTLTRKLHELGID